MATAELYQHRQAVKEVREEQVRLQTARGSDLIDRLRTNRVTMGAIAKPVEVLRDT